MKKIQRRNTVSSPRMYVFSVQTEEGMKQVKTACNMFSAPYLNEVGERIDNCAKCKEKADVIELCLYRIPEKKKAGKTKEGKTSRESKIDYKAIVQRFIAGESKEQVLRYMQQITSTENAAKDLYSKCSCVFGACVFPNRKDSLVYQVVRKVLETECTLADCIKEFPEGHKGSIKYSFDVSTAFKALKAE